jgi:hypothetical protein
METGQQKRICVRPNLFSLFSLGNYQCWLRGSRFVWGYFYEKCYTLPLSYSKVHSLTWQWKSLLDFEWISIRFGSNGDFHCYVRECTYKSRSESACSISILLLSGMLCRVHKYLMSWVANNKYAVPECHLCKNLES